MHGPFGPEGRHEISYDDWASLHNDGRCSKAVGANLVFALATIANRLQGTVARPDSGKVTTQGRPYKRTLPLPVGAQSNTSATAGRRYKSAEWGLSAPRTREGADGPGLSMPYRRLERQSKQLTA